MASQPQPLRITKTTPLNSPKKMSGSTGGSLNGIPRALNELAPTERRRNSPIHIQTSPKKMLDSSPFQSSPFQTNEGGNSPRLFWQGRDPANASNNASPALTRFNSENVFGSGRELSPSPTRRSSIERLQKASRVKNSNMFAREKKEEYDPTHIPIIERPLAKQVQGNAFDGKGISGLRNEERIKFGHNRSKSEITVTAPFSPNRSPLKENANTLVNNKFNGSVTSLSGSPSKDAGSPTKSALASTPKFGSKASYDPEHGNWDEDVSEIELPPGSRSMHRPAKSVTFNAAPPEINEYEMVTPDLSSIGGDSRENSYDSEEDEDDSYHSQQREREDSFDDSLEDTSKTPVVGPDDWRRTSLDSDYRYDDAQDHSSPMQSGSTSPQLTRVLSGDSRPLPPLPGLSGSPEREDIRTTLFGAADRASQSPSLRPTSSAGLGGSLFGGSLTKSDIQNMTGGRMPLEERLRLMMIQDAPKSAAETQRERRMRRSGNKERHSVNSEAEDSEIKIHEDEDTLAELGDYELPSHRISRESILRKVQDRTAEAGERTGSNNYYSSPMPEASSDRPSALNLDPDVPLPSVEKDNDFMDEDSIVFKPDDEDSVLDMYNNIPLAPRPKERPESRLSDNRISGAKIRQSLQDDDDISMYSELSESTPQNIGIGKDDSGPPTPKAMPKLEPSAPLPTSPLANDQNDAKAGGLDFSGFMSTNDFARSLESFRTPSPPPAPPPKDEQKVERTSSTEVKPTEQSVQPKAADIPRMKTPPPLQKVTTWGSKNDYDGAGWGSDPDEYVEEPGTPESVIRHEVKYEYSPSPSPEPEDDTPEMESPGLPVVPEKHATIKSAAGSKLKTRPSATPADIKAMMDMRRQVSHDYPIPPIPQRHLNRPSLDAKSDEQNEEPEHRSDGEVEVGQRKVSLKKKSLTLDIGIGDDLDLGLGLDKEFDDIIEQEKVAFYQSLNNPSAKHYSSTDPFRGPAAQTKTDSSNQADWIHKDFTNVTSRTQRGYLMRQNTKVVVASSDIDQPKDVRNARSAGNSPVKQQRPQSWTVEPWNGSRRKPSGRQSIGGRNKPGMGAVPPLPGMKSNVDGGLGAVAEDDIAEPEGENTERGRLFVKVIGVKDLDLPLPRNERTWFALTLDNGVHCVTTAWLELGRNAPIGQEFELVVPNELEFQLTLNAKLTRPPPKRIETGPVKPTKAAKPSTFSRVFASPKKRKEMEMKAKLEEQQLAARKQEEALAKHNSQDPTAWELLSPLSGEDGSFGRSYVCLKDHESRCYGRPYIVDVACFNEWAMEDIQGMSSVKSKTGSVVQRKRAPYKVGKLELQLLFVPKPKGAKEDDMPKSMNSCIRAMKEAEAAQERVFEGFLSQQGGDCPYWRRRLFKLSGSKLTAYHESTGQPRATINLANASKLIDDRRALTQKETTGKGGSRRKSGFAEEEEGYMFVEEGFRIRFANGEVIDFYADSTEKKRLWMEALDGVIGQAASDLRPAWCDAVLRREESVRRKEARALKEFAENREKGDMGPPARPGMPPNARDRYAHSRTKSAMA